MLPNIYKECDGCGQEMIETEALLYATEDGVLCVDCRGRADTRSNQAYEASREEQCL